MSVHVLVYVIFFNQEVKCLQIVIDFQTMDSMDILKYEKRNLVNKTLEQNKNVNIEFYLPN